MTPYEIERAYSDYVQANSGNDGFGRPEATAYALIKAARIIGKALVAAALIQKVECASCVWHTHGAYTATTGEQWHQWLCWKDSGAPEQRRDSTSNAEPPGCECHTKESVR
jgi:hypothetical protein